MRKYPACGLNAKAHTNHLPGEILVSRDIDKFEFVYIAGIDAIDDAKRVGSGFLAEFYGGVEVPTALQIVEQIALTFIQKVVIQSIFLVDWDFSFQRTAANVEALSVNNDDGPGLDQIGIVDGVGCRAVFLLSN